jgi:hypothetical protein
MNRPKKQARRGKVRQASLTADKLAGGGFAALAVIGLIAGLIFGGKAIARHMRRSTAFDRLSDTLDKYRDVNVHQVRGDPTSDPIAAHAAGFGGSVTYDTFPTEVAARRIADEIEYLPDYCRQHTDSENLNTLGRLGALASLLHDLPAGVDLQPLLRVPPGNSVYDQALEVVRSRATREQLIVAACDEDEGVRQFSARVLRRAMPFGKLDESGIAALSSPSSIADKQATFDRLFDTAHQEFAALLFGRYLLRIDAVWKSADGVETPVALTTARPVVVVGCAARTWTVTLLDQSWSGTLGEFVASPLKGRVMGELATLQGVLPDAEVSLTCGEAGLSVALQPVARYQAEQHSGGANPLLSQVRPAKEGYRSFAATLVRQ